MRKIGVWLSHPFYEQSFANKYIIERLQNLPNTDIRHIDQIYPDGKINQGDEQRYLVACDTIILQFPIFWYYCPASMKNWLDVVMGFNFALGPEGNLLKGKNLIISTTLGGPSISYTQNGYNNHTIQEYLYGIKQVAHLAQLNYRGIIATYGIKDITDNQRSIERTLQDHIQILESTLKQPSVLSY